MWLLVVRRVRGYLVVRRVRGCLVVGGVRAWDYLHSITTLYLVCPYSPNHTHSRTFCTRTYHLRLDMHHLDNAPLPSLCFPRV